MRVEEEDFSSFEGDLMYFVILFACLSIRVLGL